ncbi:MAG: hypothetical protein AB7F99_04215 [Vicinamibacterales bacterium]
MSEAAAIYGLTLIANCRLPGLRYAADTRQTDVTFELFDSQPAAVPQVAAISWDDQTLIETDGGLHKVWSGTGTDGTFRRLSYGSEITGGVIEFVLNPPGSRIWAFRHSTRDRDPISTSAVASLLAGSVLPLLLRLRGTLCLHGSAVAIGDHAVVLVGGKGAGKSTLAAALAATGHPVLADDVVAITRGTGGYLAHPGYPRLRLSPTTLSALKTSAEGLPHVLPRVEKRYVELQSGSARSWRFQPGPLKLGAIVQIARHAKPFPLIVEIMSPADRMSTLLSHVSVKGIPLDPAQQRREFVAFGQLTSTVPVRHLGCPAGLEHLDATRDAVVRATMKMVQGAA